MTEYILTRSGETSAKISGQLIGSSTSKNAMIRDKESSARQWFELDVYLTNKGTWVAHVRYRAGSRIAREEPCDMVYTSPSGETLAETLQRIDADEEFVVGWPGDGHPDENNGRDFRENDRSVCRHARLEWDSLLERSTHLFGAVEEIA